MKEVLQLLSIMTDDHRFEDIYNEELKNDKGGLKTMCDVLDRIEEKGIKNRRSDNGLCGFETCKCRAWK